MTFSLIVATRGRTSELTRLFDSLVAQTYQAFDVVVIDQNEDERLAPIVEAFKERLSVTHLCVRPEGKSSALNKGLPLGNGDVIAFPDDDCWYPPVLLENVARLLTEHPDWAGVTGRESASADAVTNERFDLEPGEISLRNIWRRHIAFTMFLRHKDARGIEFNRDLGVGAGTKWGAGEETDFLLRFMHGNRKVYYDPSLVVCHPDWGGRGPFTEAYCKKAYAYGMGMGRLLRTYGFPLQTVLKYILRPAGGMVLSVLSGSPSAVRYYRSVLSGRLSGWIHSHAEAP